MKYRIIAMYLPQFHPTRENDEWWGKGFTEWTNVANAKPLYRGHYQPHIPADLGFYDLRLDECRSAQAELASRYGIEGFCYWHYWFGNGKRLLDRPFSEVLQSGRPNFPFCLSWANHSWKKKLWNSDGRGDKVLIEQTYPGEEDIVNHFNSVLPAFQDERYIKVKGMPMFGIFAPLEHPQMKMFISIWRDLAIKNGLKGIYFVGHGNIVDRERVLSLGFDAFNDVTLFEILHKENIVVKFIKKVRARLLNWPITYRYKDAMKYWGHKESLMLDTIPSIIPNWDHSPRSRKKGIILTNATPKYFRRHVNNILSLIKNKPYDERIAILKSWNEWGEGNYIEPDLKYGKKHLEVLKDCLDSYQ